MKTLRFSKIKTSTKTKLLLVVFLTFFYNSFLVFSQQKIYTVVLDAGHGGGDPGKVGLKHTKEKDVTLKIVLQIGELLAAEKNIKVIYTRKKDVSVGLWERGRIANKADADLFVSVHCNSWHTKSPNGIETYVLGLHANARNFAVAKAENEVILLEDNHQEKYKGFDPKSPESVIGLTLMQEEYLDQSIQLAAIVQNNLVKDLRRRNRGVKQAGFVVLHQTYMPSILIETGFLTNPKDILQLNSKAGQLKTAEAIFKGIKTYIHQLTLNTVPTNVVAEKPNSQKKSPKKTVINARENIKFKVQIASGARKLTVQSYNFKGLKGVERVKVGRGYKYYLGNTSSYTSIVKKLKKAKRKGYSSAFIVAFKNGKKVSVTAALKKS